MPNLLVISGSPSRSSRTARLADHPTSRLSLSGFDAEHLDLRSLPPDALPVAVEGDAVTGVVAQGEGQGRPAEDDVKVVPTPRCPIVSLSSPRNGDSSFREPANVYLQNSGCFNAGERAAAQTILDGARSYLNSH